MGLLEASASSVLTGAISAEQLQGVLNEITALLPTVLPVMIGFIAIRKGISFLQGILHSA